MKYKVGDKVRVRKDLQAGKKYGIFDCLKEHTIHCGEIFTIEEIVGCNYRLNNNIYWWSEEMLEEVDEMKETVMRVERIEIISDGKNVRAICGQKVAVAKCAPEDKFDFFVGAKLALERLEEKCKPYSWLKRDVMYYTPSLVKRDLFDFYYYDNDEADKRLINRGMVFKTEKEAIEAAKKMLEVLKNENTNM